MNTKQRKSLPIHHESEFHEIQVADGRYRYIAERISDYNDTEYLPSIIILMRGDWYIPLYHDRTDDKYRLFDAPGASTRISELELRPRYHLNNTALITRGRAQHLEYLTEDGGTCSIASRNTETGELDVHPTISTKFAEFLIIYHDNFGDDIVIKSGYARQATDRPLEFKVYS